MCKPIWCVSSSLLLVKSPFFALSLSLSLSLNIWLEVTWNNHDQDRGAKKSTWYIYVPSFLWRTTHCFCVKSEAALQFPHYYDTKYQVVTKSINFNNKRTDAHSIAVSTVSPRLLEWLGPKKSLIPNRNPNNRGTPISKKNFFALCGHWVILQTMNHLQEFSCCAFPDWENVKASY